MKTLQPSITHFQCQNCLTVYAEHELEPTVGHLDQRVSPGEIVPAGECRKCGAVCSPIVHVVIEVKGGVVQAVHACGPMDVVVVDWDNIEHGDTAELVDVNSDFGKMPAETREKVEEILA